LSLLTTELDVLPDGALALSQTTGTGIFSGGLLGPARWAQPVLTLGAAADYGAVSVSGWLLRSVDGLTFEYGVTTGALTTTSPNVTVGSISGIWYNSGTPANSSYAFDLTTPANLPVGSYVAAAPSGNTVILNQNAAASATDTIAFVNPPDRAADFTINFAARSYMPGELVMGEAFELMTSQQMTFRTLIKPALGGALPATGNVLSINLIPEPLWWPPLALGFDRYCASPGKLRCSPGGQR
jgi:hypothetical protein